MLITSTLVEDNKYTSFRDYMKGIVERLIPIPMEAIDNNNHVNGTVDKGDYDQVDSSNGEMESTQAVSGSTQTDFDTVDCRDAGGVSLREPMRNGGGGQEGGLLSNLMTLVLPTKRKNVDEPEEEDLSRNKRCVSTQTVESPLAIRARELCRMIMQELALENRVPAASRDEVFEALCCCICEILAKHEILFNGMLRRFEVTDYRVFTSIANELFEATTGSSDFKITWGRVVSLFAFAVKLAQKYRESQEEEKIDNIINYLSDYISRHLLDFVEADGGWEGLVKQFPVPDSEEKQVKRAMMWSGLCVGLVATMAYLSK